MEAKYLIIGNSAGGIGAAEAIRQIDNKGTLVMVSDEPYPSYSRPLISKYLSGERDLDGMLYRPADFYERNNVTAIFGKKVNKLDLESHYAELDGEKITWKKLLLATGGKPIVPVIKGGDKRGVFSFITLDDAKAIDGYLNNVSEAVVIGGGLIGISVTEALNKRGINVSVVEMKDRILNTILDGEASLMAEEIISRTGVKLITGHTVIEVTGREQVTGVVLDDGTKIPCNMVVIAIGVVPRAELAEKAGIKVDRGILVDNHMRTNHPDVYACGDSAEAYDFLYGINRVIPILPNAYIGGMVAGDNMAGGKNEYTGGTAMNSLNYFGLDIATAGMVNPPEGDECEVVVSRDNTLYRKLILRMNRIVGMVFVGDIDKSGIFFRLMRDQIDVGGFKQGLLADDFGLASLPRDKWQERLECPSPESESLVV